MAHIVWDLKTRRGLAVDREKSRAEFLNGVLGPGYKIEIAFFKANFVSAGGLEPPTLCLKGRCSTPELRARITILCYFQPTFQFLSNYQPSEV